ncbi:hypothetical protein ACNI3Q_13935 [Sphingomonas sp. FW199]|uniref:hypothetical protein n=1 Tax=Sphingomonas sp. FW199 TaxID=3400217 RepID=UPI003CF1470D
MAVTTDNADAVSPSPSGDARRKRWRMAALVLTLIGVGYFLVESMLYRGISAAINEWQFDRLGYALPVITFAVLAALISAPVWLIYWLIVRRRQSAPAAPMSVAGWREQALRFRRLADGTAAVLVVLALATLIWGMIIAGTATPVTIGGNGAAPGTRALAGSVDVRRAVTVSSSVILFRRQSRYAPLIEPGDRGPIRHFVELSSDADAPILEQGRPLLRVRGQVPGAAVAVYRANGMPVARDRYLLSRSTASVQFPYRVGASLLVFAALVAFILGRWQTRRIPKLDPEAKATTPSAATAA